MKILPLASAMQTPKRRFCPLHQRCKCQNEDFTPCINDANTKTMILPLASTMQIPKRRFYLLHQRCKHQKAKFTGNNKTENP
jgi:hypothetical protein